MKRIIQFLSVVSLAIAFGAISANAQSSRSFAASVPFSFSVGQKTLDAGTYKIKVTTSASGGAKVTFIDIKGNSVGVVLGTIDSNAKLGRSELVFDRSGGRRSLSGITTAGLGVIMPVSQGRKSTPALVGLTDDVVVPLATVN
jgi:hypothetical protein